MNKISIDEMMKNSEEIFGEENQLAAVKQDGLAIRFIYNPSEMVQLAAVKENGLAIQFIHNPSEQVHLEAVKDDGYAIQWIHNPSEDVQLAAVKQNGNAIRFFKKAWRKGIAKKLTVEQIEEILGYKVEIVSDQK